jgi:putative alpha-1,2-mannosidase
MMGLYPVTPGVPIYDLCSPFFDRTSIRLHNGKTFTIVARHNSAKDQYVRSITLNGQRLTKVWLKHSDLVNGGTLELEMGDTPNKNLGVAAGDLPPSALDLDPGKL